MIERLFKLKSQDTFTYLSGAFVALLLGFVAPVYAATVTITGADRASNVILGETATAKPTIYGAIAGPACASPVTTSTCNNCTGGTACSERRIHPNLRLRINFTVTTETAGAIQLGYVNGGAYTPFNTNTYTPSTTATVSKGNDGYVEVDWGTICQHLSNGNDATCSTSVVDKDIFVAISPDATISAEEATLINARVFAPNDNTDIDTIDCSEGKDGVCSFVASPGDEKVYIDPIEPSGNYPTVNNVPVIALRVFFDSTPGADIATSITYASPYTDIGVDDLGYPEPRKIQGLENDILYGFKIAIIDQAYNISYLTSADQMNDPTFGECTGGTTLVPANDITCPFMATPSNVLGVLPEDVNCFISTAAYGSSMAEQVQTFRTFRNRILLQTRAGIDLVKAYYTFGPQAARFINDYPALKPAARAILWPLWAFATLSLKWGFGYTLLAFIIASFSIGFVIIGGTIKCARSTRSA